jgi:predicted permease
MAYDFLRDTRIAARTLRRTPSFSVAVILTFGLGIGASSSMFSVYDGVLLRPLPYPESDRIVRLFQLNEAGARGNISEPNYLDWQQGTHSFSGMAEMARSEEPVSGRGEPMVTVVTTVSQGFFEVMGVKPATGRTFVSDEQREGAAPVVVVSADFWRRTRDGETRPPTNDDIVRVGSLGYTIVGVMPPGFDYPAGTKVWRVRERMPPQTSRSAHNFQAVARLKDGVGLGEARADISALSRSLKSTYKDQTWMSDATAIPILEVATGRSRQGLDMLFIASVLLLVVAAANVSNLMVARAASRQRDFAVQLSLGATPGRLRLQALAEALVLCVGGGLFGVVLAAVVVPLFATLGPASAPRLESVGVNWRGVAFAGLPPPGSSTTSRWAAVSTAMGCSWKCRALMNSRPTI